MAETRKKISYMVADTTAFINQVPLNEYADWVLTVPDVVSEVSNKRQIRRLCVLPFDLQVREPRAESIRHCVDFSKKTGDYASLSGIDIKVIALTYELEADNVGTAHLRTEPVVSRTVASKEKPEEFQENTKLAGWYNPKAGDADDSEESDEEDDDDFVEFDEKAEDHEENGNEAEAQEKDKVDTVKAAIERQMELPESAENAQDEISQEELDKLFEKLKCEPEENDQTCDLLVPQSKIADSADDKEKPEEASDEEQEDDSTENSTAAAADDMDDSGWITPANIKKVKRSLEGKVDEDLAPLVACMSTDFAVQNTLKQMNLHIAALNGRVIKHLRTYILRCYACFKTTSIMTKVFCPNCGNKTLKRVAVSLDENGKQVIHINTRRSLTTKYKNQSVPRFQGGKHSRNPILFEDQPIPRQMPSRVSKTKTNALDDDYIAGYSPFVMRDVDSRSAMLREKGNIKEWARNNTFEEDRRRKSYTRLCK